MFFGTRFSNNPVHALACSLKIDRCCCRYSISRSSNLWKSKMQILVHHYQNSAYHFHSILGRGCRRTQGLQTSNLGVVVQVYSALSVFAPLVYLSLFVFLVLLLGCRLMPSRCLLLMKMIHPLRVGLRKKERKMPLLRAYTKTSS